MIFILFILKQDFPPGKKQTNKHTIISKSKVATMSLLANNETN